MIEPADNLPLIVEDSALVAMVAEDLFLAQGLGLSAVEDRLEDALRLVAVRTPSFALLVTELEDGDTAPLAAILRARGVPFAFVCAFADCSDIPEGFAGTPSLCKPYEARELMAVLAGMGVTRAAALG